MWAFEHFALDLAVLLGFLELIATEALVWSTEAKQIDLILGLGDRQLILQAGGRGILL